MEEICATHMILMVLHDPDPRRQPLTATTESPVPMNPDFLPKSMPKFTRSSTSRVQSGFSAPSQNNKKKDSILER
jgi:hypothetical protein